MSASEAYSETCQTSKMQRFAKIGPKLLLSEKTLS